ncbi:MAG TPA: DNA repair protein RecN [Candidatus Baltobacteraceae bacterium]|nr:DNA repair protein RecN [Candidatus Baltobacteraceae bacterium]
MLRRLEIEHYGLIARADIAFADGATIFTGETGSGKTMLLGALAFALGARVGADVVRRGAAKAIVTLAFDPSRQLRARLADDGFELDPDEDATIQREMSDAGRSSLRVNGRPSTAAYVRALGDDVAEIVGQHEAQRLLSASYHLEMLDRFAGEAALRTRDAVARLHARAAEAAEELAQIRGQDRQAHERYEEAAFAAEEIDGANLELGEDLRLEERRRYLDNVERVAAALRRTHEALAGDDASATSALGDASVALSSIGDVSDALQAMAAQAAVLQSEASDLASIVAKALGDTELDPGELESINVRLDRLDRLKRKYGGSLDAVRAFAVKARAIADEYEGRDRRVAELETQLAAVQRDLGEQAGTLTALREKAAALLCKRVLAEFPEIALGSGRFEVCFEALDRIGPHGAERVEFQFAANAGEPARSLSRVASGGELSRVLLALVVTLSDAQTESALVFDEIDAGIGGTTAAAVGARIGRLAKRGQVICVTHLAQLATWADRHYVLEKTETKSETTITVREIAARAQREEELARMLSGQTHDAALKHARALLEGRFA